MSNLNYIIPGIIFGIILTKSEVISWFRIRKMFLLEEPFMYLVIGSAVLTGIISVQILKRLNITARHGGKLNLKGKDYHRGIIFGSILFGIGWAITGACPGPVFAQVGAGEYAAIFTLAGAVLGAYVYHALRDRLPH